MPKNGQIKDQTYFKNLQHLSVASVYLCCFHVRCKQWKDLDDISQKWLQSLDCGQDWGKIIYFWENIRSNDDLLYFFYIIYHYHGHDVYV